MPEIETLPVDAAAIEQPADLSQTASGADDTEGTPTPPAELSRLERLKALLDEVEPGELDEVTRHPKVSGKIGSAADRLAQKRLADQAEQQRVEAERKLRDSDPFEFARIKREEEQQELARQAELAKLQGFTSSVQSRLEAYAREQFTPDELAAAAKLADGKPFDEGVLAWVQATGETSFERKYAERLKHDLPTLRARWLAEEQGQEPSPDVEAAPAAAPSRGPRSMAEADTLFLADKLSASEYRAARRKFGG